MNDETAQEQSGRSPGREEPASLYETMDFHRPERRTFLAIPLEIAPLTGAIPVPVLTVMDQDGQSV